MRVAMPARGRFQPFYSWLCQDLKLDSDTAKELRPLMLRYWAQSLSRNACLTLMKQALADKVARDDAAIAALPLVDPSEIRR